MTKVIHMKVGKPTEVNGKNHDVKVINIHTYSRKAAEAAFRAMSDHLV